MSEPATIDCHYLQPQLAAAYLLQEGDEAAFVETNTTHAVPRLLGALAERGLSAEQVRWIIVTHVHLDHAGGASALMEACPAATLLAHPRAARHLIDPRRLVASAKAVYGEAQFEALYGSISAIPAARVRPMGDDETLDWGDRTMRFLHTRGHANHHFCIHDSKTDGVFSGDAFGLRYPRLQRAGLVVFPSTSPTDFDPQAARESVQRIAALARCVWPTHFGRLEAVSQAASQLEMHLDYAEALLECAVGSAVANEDLATFCHDALVPHLVQSVEAAGLTLSADDLAFLDLDLDLNAQGIAWAAQKRRAAS